MKRDARNHESFGDSKSFTQKGPLVVEIDSSLHFVGTILVILFIFEEIAQIGPGH